MKFFQERKRVRVGGSERNVREAAGVQKDVSA